MCKKCDGGCNSCKCTCNKRCVNENCACSVYLSSDCVTSFTEDLPCSGVLAGGTLNETILALDAYICDRFGDVGSFFELVNVGTGSGLYKGTNNLGQKEIKSLIVSGLISLTEQTNTVTITVNETALSNFIKANQFTYSAQTVGEEGEAVYVGSTTSVNNTSFKFKTIKSDTLSITATETEISIEQPNSASIPAIYVNSSYIPTYDEFISGNGKGQGTLAKPYTNTVSYSSPVASPTITANSSIQNALNAYVGDGTRLNPDLQGLQIIVQNNNSGYTFAGDFNYTRLNIKIEANIISTNNNYLIDMDNSTYFDPTSSRADITVDSGFFLEIQGQGFKNSGNTVATVTYATGRIIIFSGEGIIRSQTNNVNYYMFNLDPTGSLNGTTGLNNDGSVCMQVNCSVSCQNQGIVKIGGKSRIEFNGNIQSTATSTALKAIHQIGGQIVISKSLINMDGVARTTAFYFEPTNGFSQNIFTRDVQISGNPLVWFTKASTSASVGFDWQDGSALYVSSSNLFASPNLWIVVFNNNNIPVRADFSIVEFSQSLGASTFNLLGGYVTASLIQAQSKAQAVSMGVITNALFINRKNITAGNFVVGQEYKINLIGTTDFTLIGAASNTIGIFFVASGIGVGSGSAYLDKLDIVT